MLHTLAFPRASVAVQSEGDVLTEFYRYPQDLLGLPATRKRLGEAGFFRVGKQAVCYGSTSLACPSRPDGDLPDVLEAVMLQEGRTTPLPFDPREVIDNLRLERYPEVKHSILSSSLLRRIYYSVRPLLSASIRNVLQRRYFCGWERLPFPAWPVDAGVEHLHSELLLLAMKLHGVERVPFIWFWPDGATSAAMMTHDVETAKGRDFVPRLLKIDREFGVKASYQLVPEHRYQVPAALLDLIRAHGCEINVHDLNHGGNLFSDREDFRRQAQKINHHVRAFEAEGFRAGCMYRNAAWFSDLAVAYDLSVPNVAHLEPQRGGACTVFPYFIGDIVELPLTTIQDFSLFHVLRSYSTDLWEQQMNLIMEHHGLISFIVHPDYILEDQAMQTYKALLEHISEARDTRGVWLAKPGEIARWWRERSATTLVRRGKGYCIEGPGRERARIAHAIRDGDRIRYEL